MEIGRGAILLSDFDKIITRKSFVEWKKWKRKKEEKRKEKKKKKLGLFIVAELMFYSFIYYQIISHSDIICVTSANKSQTG